MSQDAMIQRKQNPVSKGNWCLMKPKKKKYCYVVEQISAWIVKRLGQPKIIFFFLKYFVIFHLIFMEFSLKWCFHIRAKFIAKAFFTQPQFQWTSLVNKSKTVLERDNKCVWANLLVGWGADLLLDALWIYLISGKHTTTNRERSGSVVECLTRDWGAMDLSLTGVTALCPWARTLILA